MRRWTDTLRNRQAEAPNGLELLRPVVEPDPETWQRIRQDFLTEAGEYSVQAVTSTRDSRHNDWRTRLGAFLSFDRRKRSMIVVMKALLALALVVAGGSGTVYAMQNSLPGSPLYGLKLNVEDMRLENADDAEARFELTMAMARNRVEETIRLLRKGEDVPTHIAERYRRSLAAALAAADELPEAAQVRAGLANELDEQLREMAQVRNQIQEVGEGEGGEGAMERVMTQAQQQLGGNQGPPEGDQEPLQQQEQEQERLETQLQEQLKEQLQIQQDAEQQQQTQVETQSQIQPQTQNQNQNQVSQPEDSPPASPGGNGH